VGRFGRCGGRSGLIILLARRRSRRGRRKAALTDASGTLARKNCAAKFRKFVVWLCTIRRASRVSPTNKIRAFCRKVGNSIAALSGAMDAVPGIAPRPHAAVLRAADGFAYAIAAIPSSAASSAVVIQQDTVPICATTDRLTILLERLAQDQSTDSNTSRPIAGANRRHAKSPQTSV
jgi:hypothetical protein